MMIIIINHCHKCLSNAVVGVPAEIWAATAPVPRGAEPTLTMSTVSQVNDRLDIVVLLLFTFRFCLTAPLSSHTSDSAHDTIVIGLGPHTEGRQGKHKT